MIMSCFRRCYRGRIERIGEGKVHVTLVRGDGVTFYANLDPQKLESAGIPLMENKRFDVFVDLSGDTPVVHYVFVPPEVIPESFHEESKRLLAGIDLGT
jgi:hypothetical protein